MQVTLYGLKSCDACKKAMKTLQNSGDEISYIDVRTDGVKPADLKRFHSKFGEALTNTRYTTWRGLDETERSRPALELLSDHPTLMKRPVIVADGQLYLGWGKDVQAKFET